MKRVTVTMHDVARLAGVSQTTVSLILNQSGSASFSQETVNRVYAAAAQLNYKAKRPITQGPRPKTVMVLMANVTNPYYTAMLSSIEDVCYAQGYKEVSCCTYHDTESEKLYMEMAVSNNYPGVILLSPPDNPAAFAEVSAKIPVVTICDRISNLETDIIELNNCLAGRLAAEHLHALGHQRIAVLTSPLKRNTARTERLNGLKAYFAQHLPDNDLVLCIENNSEADNLAERLNDYHAGYLLAQNEKLYDQGVTAIVCINDMLAYGVIDSLRERGISVPEDVSVLGFDNLFYSRLTGVSLTTVDQHTEMLARSAVEVLLQKLKMPPGGAGAAGTVPRYKVECHPQLVARGTTAPPPAQSRLVLK